MFNKSACKESFMQQASSSVLTLYAILHWGPGGEGTGYTIVAARSENMARQFAAIHLRAKPEGYRQFASASCLEVMLLEDSVFAPLAEAGLDGTVAGVKSEYWFKPGQEDGEPVLVSS
ncbi:MAG TPA: hypothetical protein PLI59_00140 [Candidatus Obscuribacter sp.]|nr:hypothetical protein [Candidatus Obscuribacter sp.]